MFPENVLHAWKTSQSLHFLPEKKLSHFNVFINYFFEHQISIKGQTAKGEINLSLSSVEKKMREIFNSFPLFSSASVSNWLWSIVQVDGAERIFKVPYVLSKHESVVNWIEDHQGTFTMVLETFFLFSWEKT